LWDKHKKYKGLVDGHSPFFVPHIKTGNKNTFLSICKGFLQMIGKITAFFGDKSEISVEKDCRRWN